MGTRIVSKFTVRDTDAFVRQHRVQDIHILPGVAMLDAVYKTFLARGVDPRTITLKSILFHEPVVTNEFTDRKLTLTWDMDGKRGRITVSSIPWRGSAALGDRVTTHMTCTVERAESEQALFDLDSRAIQLPPNAVDLDACYDVTRRIGIFHEGFMKCQGRVGRLESGQYLGEIALGNEAARARDFQLHPVFLDCSTIVPLLAIREQLQEQELFIPIAIDEFRATSLLGHTRLRVLVEPFEQRSTSDVLRYRFGLYDWQGRGLARVVNFTVKRVRSLEGIRQLLTRSNTVSAVPKPALHDVSSDYRDPVRGLIGAILGDLGSFSYAVGDDSKPFFDLGLSSSELLEAVEALEVRLQVELYPTTLFEYPNVAALATHLRDAYPDACARFEAASPRVASTTLTSSTERFSAAEAGVVGGCEVTMAVVSNSVTEAASKSRVMAKIEELVAARLPRVQMTAVTCERSFFELGLDSSALLEVADELEKQLEICVYPTTLFEHPTISALARHLEAECPELREASSGQAEDPPPSRPSQVVVRAAALASEVPRSGQTSAASSDSAEVFAPRWVPVVEHPRETGSGRVLLVEQSPSHLGTQLAELHGSRIAHRGTVSELENALTMNRSFDEVCLVDLDHYSAFRVIRMLRNVGALTRPLTLRAITSGCFQVHDEVVQIDAPHGLWGLLLSTSREYPETTVIQWDVTPGEIGHGLSSQVLAIAPTRTLRALRHGRCYRRILAPVTIRREVEEIAPSAFGATFVVVGGASGVGLEWVRHLVRNYGARVAVVGRRDARSALSAGLGSLPEFGQEVTYHIADVDDEVALERAFRAIRTTFGAIHCVVHSAMVLDDRRLAEMDDACFERVQAPKVAGTRTLARVAQRFGVEQFLFFSSAQAFVGNAGQANYAAASTYVDGFANALRCNSALKVTIVDWGYWGEVGAVTSEHYQRLLARQGVFGMTTRDALSRLDDVLSNGFEQAVVMRGSESVFAEMQVDRETHVARARVSVGEHVSLRQLIAAPEAVTEFEHTRLAVGQLVSIALRRAAAALGEVEAERRLFAPAHARLLAVLRMESQGQAMISEAEFVSKLDELVATHPVVSPLVPLLRDCIRAYPDVLTGRKPAMAVVFPGGRNDLVRAVYAESNVSRYFNSIAADAVRQLAANSPRPLRILEVGAGTGATTRAVLDTLSSVGAPCEYWFTELWDALLTDARQRLSASYPELRFACLDAGLDPATQGFTGGGYDVVIATNVLHATRNVRASLRNLKKLLRPGGALVVNESIATQPYSTLTFGLLPGWWHATDPEERLADSPLLDESSWLRALADTGFVGRRSLVAPDEKGDVPGGQQVFVAWSDGEICSTKNVAVPASPRRAERAKPAEVPAALHGKLREFEPRTAPRARRIATYADHCENIWVFLNNPPANMFDDEFLAELCATLQGVAASVEQKGKVVYLSHFGEYFSLGGDRSELLRNLHNPAAIEAFADKVRALFRIITSLNAIVVAVVNGTAQGGGLETLFATDLQVVRTGVKLGLPEVRSGLIPGMGGLTRLQSVLGPARTKRLVLLGDLIDASEAHDLGIVSHVVDDPFTAALAIGDSLEHIEAALQMKRILRPQAANELCADIDDWVRYLGTHAGMIDARRIENSRLLVTGRAAMGVRR
jgi:enoyl-CoA hydratase/carnithine racemase/NAD(P)-dependent dehydrogenase (short-subunit alcohol dehydrogenase family)/acyl carrier protein/SAM-dependent methyltransferase